MWVMDGYRYFGVPYLGGSGYVHDVLDPKAIRYGVSIPPAISVGDPVAAFVNHNRWIVRCPDCGGCSFVWVHGQVEFNPEDCLFMCENCWNGVVGNLFRQVTVPENFEDIEAALSQRPLPENRNWLPGETLAQLEAENEVYLGEVG